MYVDESGDTGIVRSPGRYFVLTGMVVHELRWHTYLDQLVGFRRRMRKAFTLKLREEIHASQMLARPGELARIKKYDRLTIIRAFARELASMPDLNLINVVVDKRGKRPDYDVFGMAWRALIQRFENTVSHRNFRGPANADDCGMILPDQTDVRRLTLLLRSMRKWNPVPNQAAAHGVGYRNLTLAKIVEDPHFKDSEHSYFIQACDLSAFLLNQNLVPNAYMRRRGGSTYFKILDPILCKVASSTDVQGIVRL